MSRPVLTRSPWLRLLPPVVAAEVRHRRGQILAAAAGRILDLDDPAADQLLSAPALASAEWDATDPGFDVIVSTARLVAAPDLLSSVTAIVDRLAPGGALHCVEPVGVPGAVGLVAATLGSLLPAVRGLHLNRDVPATVRATGLTIIDTERFAVPTATWPLRHFVQLRAMRLPEAEPAAEPEEVTS